MTAPPRPLLAALTALSLLVLAAGCESEPRHVGGKTKKAQAQAQAPAPAPAPAKPADTFIVGKTTSDIKKSDGNLPANAKIASQKIVAKDPITLQGNAYVTAIGQTAMNNIKHAMDLFQAEEGRYPKDYAEFKARIIDANNMRLPHLPFYQEYRYNENTHALEIWEYPDKKAGPLPGG